MGAHIAEWLGLVFRWLHVLAAMAWIGNSFYFNWLDRSFKPPEEPREGVGGEVWMTHGGGFYHVDKFSVSPPKMPKELHWFMWEAYTTWISGFLLIAVLYYYGASLYMVNAAQTLSPVAAVHAGLGTLFGGWLLYHFLHKSPLGRYPRVFAGLSMLALTALAYGLCQVFSPRAAYLHVGALLGTCMAFNVWRVIIPNQRKMVASMEAGEAVDGSLGVAAKGRSVHNNYMTLPVVFVMIASHFPSTYGHAYNWLILSLLMLTGVLIRLYLNMRTQGKTLAWIPPLVVASLVGLTWWTAPAARETTTSPQGGERVSFAAARVVIAQRCSTCHSSAPSDSPFGVAPGGVMFDTPEQIQTQAARIRARAVELKTMPMANQTGMSDEERELLGKWIDQGALLE